MIEKIKDKIKKSGLSMLRTIEMMDDSELDLSFVDELIKSYGAKLDPSTIKRVNSLIVRILRCKGNLDYIKRKILEDNTISIKQALIESLKYFPEEEAVNFLVFFYQPSIKPIALKVVETLVHLVDEVYNDNVKKFFVYILRNDSDLSIKEYALLGLGKIGDRSAVPYIEKFLREFNMHKVSHFHEVFSFAVFWALKKIGGSEAERLIIKYIEDVIKENCSTLEEYDEICSSVLLPPILALMDIGSKNSLPTLMLVYKSDVSEKAKEAAMVAIGRIIGKNA